MSEESQISVVMSSNAKGSSIKLIVENASGEPITAGQLALVLSQLVSVHIGKAMGIQNPDMQILSASDLKGPPEGMN